MAGAKSGEIVWFVVRSNGRALAVGLACGLALAVAISKVIQGCLFGLRPLDAAAYGAVLAVMLSAGIAAIAIYGAPVRGGSYFPLPHGRGSEVCNQLRNVSHTFEAQRSCIVPHG